MKPGVFVGQRGGRLGQRGRYLGQGGMHVRQGGMHLGQAAFTPEQPALHAEQAALHAVQGELHAEQGELHAEQGELHAEQGELHAEQAALHEEQAALSQVQRALYEEPRRPHAVPCQWHSSLTCLAWVPAQRPSGPRRHFSLRFARLPGPGGPVRSAAPFLRCSAPMRLSVGVPITVATVGVAACGGSNGAGTATGTLLLQAFGGASGQVAAQVPVLETGVGAQQTCGSPVVAGACQLVSCQVGGIGSPLPGYGDFGPLSASVGATTVNITYDRTGYPTVYFPAATTLGTGGTMTFHGGYVAGIPTFDVSATIPGVAVLTSPVPASAGGSATIDTAQDLSVAWVPIPSGQIHFELEGGSGVPGGTAVALRCTFDGVVGAGVVAHSLLASLKQTSGTGPTYASVSSEIDATTTVGGLTILTQSFQSSPTALSSFDVILQ